MQIKAIKENILLPKGGVHCKLQRPMQINATFVCSSID